MSVLERVWAILSSRRLSVWIMGLIVVGYAMWVVPFQVYGVPTWRVQNIATAIGFQILGVALLVNGIACLVAHGFRVARRVKAGFGPSAESLRGSAARVYSTTADAHETRDRAAKVLRRRGFTVVREDELLRAYKGRLSPVGTLLSHLAIVLVAVAVIVTTQSLFTGKLVLVEGENTDASDRASYAEPPARELAALPDSRLPKGTVELVTVYPSFWRDVQLFNRLEARINVDGRAEKIRINHPVRLGSAWVAVSGFGYAPEVRLDRPDGTSETFFVKLKVFPPGSIDQFELPESPYRVDMKVFPDATVAGDRVANRSYNLRDPALVLRVSDITQSSGSGTYQGTLRMGQPAEFDGYTLRVPSIRYYAELRVVRNDGVIWFLAAFLLTVVGLWMRFGMRRRVIVLSATPTAEGAQVRMVIAAEHWHSGFAHVTARDLERTLDLEGHGTVEPAADGEHREVE